MKPLHLLDSPLSIRLAHELNKPAMLANWHLDLQTHNQSPEQNFHQPAHIMYIPKRPKE
jgi:hypothetical protein